jgi:hypothetical protein
LLNEFREVFGVFKALPTSMFSFGASSGNSVGKIGLKNKTNSNNKKKWTRGVVL